MGSYEILWKDSAERDLRNIDPQQVPRIIKAVEALARVGQHAVAVSAEGKGAS